MSTIRPQTRNRIKSTYAVLAGTVLTLLVMPIALAGGAEDPEVTARVSVEKQVKKLKRQVKQLRQQIQEVSKQPGPTGEQGPPGPSTGPAGGDLTGSYPDPQIGPNAIGTPEIADDAVGFDDIGPNAVGTGAIASNNVLSEDIANDSVGNSEVANSAISTAEIANGNVQSVDLGGSAVEAPNLGPAVAVVGTGVSIGAGNSQQATVTCPGGSRLLGGGFEWQTDNADGLSIISSSPSFAGNPNTTWVVRGRVDTGGTGTVLFAEALCLSA